MLKNLKEFMKEHIVNSVIWMSIVGICLFLAFMMLTLNGCAVNSATDLECTTERTVSKSCKSKGTGHQIIVHPNGESPIQ
jgi:hypothetical protein